MKKFSVLMSIYHKEKSEYFNRAMLSIWDEQTVKPDEIVLVQDGKLTDDLYIVISEWKNKLGDILKVIPLEQNVGLGGALNEGIKHCSYELIARMDTDDIALPDRFEKQLKVFENSDIDICSGWISEFDSDENEIILNNKIISIGTLIGIKGFERLIRAWSFVEPFSNEYILEIYGEAEDKLNLDSVIKELKLKKVFLRGQVDDMPSVYRRASFFVMSSYYEGLPMVLIESQSFGLPIVSFDCPFGPSEIITNNHDGFLVENGNIELLADKIKYLIKNKNIIEKFSINSLESAKRFTEEKIITQWKELIENAK